jgi:hypothetical protein
MESDEAEKNRIRGREWTMDYRGIGELLRRSQGSSLVPFYRPTVRKDKFLVNLEPRNEPNEEMMEQLECLMNSMQILCYPMEPYRADKIKAEKAQKHIQYELSKADSTAEFVVFDIAGRQLAGENHEGFDTFAAGLPCYHHGAGSVQATVLEPGNAALYGARLPTERGSEMYAAAKARFPELLQPLVKAVAQIENKV